MKTHQCARVARESSHSLYVNSDLGEVLSAATRFIKELGTAPWSP